MESVADTHRHEDRRRLAAMTTSERIRLAFELGDRDLEIFRSRRGLGRDEALRELRLQRQLGRTPCSFFENDP
jgi:hypothetical protein